MEIPQIDHCLFAAWERCPQNGYHLILPWHRCGQTCDLVMCQTLCAAFGCFLCIHPSSSYDVTILLCWIHVTMTIVGKQSRTPHRNIVIQIHQMDASQALGYLSFHFLLRNPTLPKTKSSPLKIGNPKKKFHLPTIHFQWQTVSFREGIIFSSNLRGRRGPQISLGPTPPRRSLAEATLLGIQLEGPSSWQSIGFPLATALGFSMTGWGTIIPKQMGDIDKNQTEQR